MVKERSWKATKPHQIDRRATEMGMKFKDAFNARMVFLKSKVADIRNHKPSNATNNRYKKLLVAELDREITALVKYANNRAGRSPIPNNEIIIARNFPVSQVMQFNEGGSAHAFCHPDTDMSLKDYGSHAYCFSCELVVNAIDIVMHFHGMEFRDAVAYLNNLDECGH